MRALKMLAATAALAFVATAAQAEELRIGYLTTNSGPAAVIGEQVVNAWKLGLEHEGWQKVPQGVEHRSGRLLRRVRLVIRRHAGGRRYQ